MKWRYKYQISSPVRQKTVVKKKFFFRLRSVKKSKKTFNFWKLFHLIFFVFLLCTEKSISVFFLFFLVLHVCCSAVKKLADKKINFVFFVKKIKYCFSFFFISHWEILMSIRLNRIRHDQIKSRQKVTW